MSLTKEEYDALINLIALEQIDIIDDEENEFWNTIRRKLRHLTYQSALWLKWTIIQKMSIPIFITKLSKIGIIDGVNSLRLTTP